MANFINSVVILDHNADEIATYVKKARPDLQIWQPDTAQPFHCEAPYAVITFHPGPQINRYKNTKWVHCTGAGVDRILAALEFEPPCMTRTLGGMGAQIGEYVLTYYLADLQHSSLFRSLQDRRVWDQEAAQPGRAAAKQALIVGTGGIGQGVADALVSIGVNCIGVSRTGDEQHPFQSIMAFENLDQHDLGEIDLIVGALPASPSTKHIFNEKFFDRFNHAFFINVGRGRTLNEDAFTGALASGRIRGAALDVFDQEPLPAGSALWQAKDVIITPHISGLSHPKYAADDFLRELERMENGQKPKRKVSIRKGY